jgi:hypothetical protein
VSIAYRLARVVLELRDPRRTVRWKAEVALAADPLRLGSQKNSKKIAE